MRRTLVLVTCVLSIGLPCSGCDDKESKPLLAPRSDGQSLPFFADSVVGCGELSQDQRKTPSLWLRFVGPEGPGMFSATVTSRTFEGAWDDYPEFHAQIESDESGCAYVSVLSEGQDPTRVRRGRVEFVVTIDTPEHLGVARGIELREGVKELGIRVWEKAE